MSKFMLLTKQLYKQKVRSKSFILMLVLYIGIITGIAFWSDISAVIFGDDVQQVAVINETDFDMEHVFVSDEQQKWTFVSALDDQVKQEIQDGDYLAAIELSDLEGQLKANVISYDPLPLNDQQSLIQKVEYASQLFAMSQLNLTDEQAAALLDTSPELSSTTLNEEALDGKTTDEKQAGVWVSYVVGFIIYFFVTTFLSMITTEVASEKGSRALEMLLVSVKPETHFRSKLFGVFFVALTQFAILLAAVFLLLRFTDNGEKWTMVTNLLGDISSVYILYVVAFLFTTIFLFLIIGALFGSLVSKVEEASQVMTPAIMVTLVGFYVMISGLSNPDTMLIKVFSYIPFTSGMVMPMRIGATDIAAYEPLLSLAILVVTTLVMYFLSLSFYKRSVLTYSTGGIIQKIKTVLKVTT